MEAFKEQILNDVSGFFIAGFVLGLSLYFTGLGYQLFFDLSKKG